MLSFEFSSPVWREEAHSLVEPAPESVSPYRVELGFAPSVWREAHGLVGISLTHETTTANTSDARQNIQGYSHVCCHLKRSCQHDSWSLVSRMMLPASLEQREPSSEQHELIAVVEPRHL